MNFFTKHFFFRVLTGCLFAGLAWSMVKSYQLFDFSYSAETTFLFVLLGYLFLSQKYTPFMQVFCVVLGLTMTYKLSPHVLPAQSTNDDFLRARALFLQVIRYNLDGEQSLPTIQSQNFDFCLKRDCPENLQKLTESRYWIFEKQDMQDDKPKSVWYIDENMQLFSKIDQNLSQIPMPILSGQE